MTALLLNDLRHCSDHVRLRGGRSITIRFIEPRDAGPLQDYFRSLSVRSRYNRFLGATNELAPGELAKYLRSGEDESFAAVATTVVNGIETIVGETRYTLDADSACFELSLSIDDRWQGHGIGAALLSNLQCRAAALGAKQMFGDTLRSNDAMIGLARKAGFGFVATPGDWKLVRFIKHIDLASRDIPCASWQLAAVKRATSHDGVSAR